MGSDISSILYMTFLSNIQKHSLPIYQNLHQAIRIHLEEGKKACLELYDKPWNGC